ncbi:NUDIX hydrolase [Nonlabens xiamenensis]|uniref:NUDIX hydrolase n=1 Tax=Nonlabens xiamenensis TaxID=2341043 RepID=UPI000F60BF3F|nr:CoA pyrophosphatase [Nonlabens xiamenensis]
MSLPGLDSQMKMAAVERLVEMQQVSLSDRKPRKASVMMLIYPKDDIAHFVLIERAQTKGKHSGQIAFPGGRREPEDQDAAATAVRETWEEIGVHPKYQEVVKASTPLYIPPSNYMVYPFIAFAKAQPTFKAQPSEVNSILEIPLQLLLEEESINSVELSTSYMDKVKVPCFYFGTTMVWGATAMMLYEIKEMLKASLAHGR